MEIQRSQPNTEKYIPAAFCVKANTSRLTSPILYLPETTKAQQILLLLLPLAELPWGFSAKLNDWNPQSVYSWCNGDVSFAPCL